MSYPLFGMPLSYKCEQYISVTYRHNSSTPHKPQHQPNKKINKNKKGKLNINNAIICYTKTLSHIKHFWTQAFTSHNHKISPMCLLALSLDSAIRSASFENWWLIPCVFTLKLFRNGVWPCFLICFSDSPDTSNPEGTSIRPRINLTKETDLF